MTPSPAPDSRSGEPVSFREKWLNNFRDVIESCFPGDEEDLAFERESAIAFIQAMHDAARIAAERAALTRAVQVIQKYIDSHEGPHFRDELREIQESIRALAAPPQRKESEGR